jgi:hypothetical protein
MAALSGCLGTDAFCATAVPAKAKVTLARAMSRIFRVILNLPSIIAFCVLGAASNALR